LSVKEISREGRLFPSEVGPLKVAALILVKFPRWHVHLGVEFLSNECVFRLGIDTECFADRYSRVEGWATP